MKKIKKLIALLVCLVMTVSLLPVYALADDEDVVMIGEGFCGEDVQWGLSEDGILVILGYNAMDDYAASGTRAAPWAKYRDQIVLVLVYYVTHIGNNAFYGCENIQEIDFYGDAPSFGTNCFYGVEAVAYYPIYSDTWTDDKFYSYGGDIYWMDYAYSGDVDLDSELTNADLILVARFVVNLIDPESEIYENIRWLGDVNDDESVDNKDIILIARALVGLDG